MIVEIVTGSIFALIAVVALVQPRSTLRNGKVRYSCNTESREPVVKNRPTRQNSAELELARQLEILAQNVKVTQTLAGIDTSKERRAIGKPDRRFDGVGNRRKG